MEPRVQSATERRELRRSIRNGLGTSREEAPTAMQVIAAAQHLDRLMQLASGDTFRVVITDNMQGAPTKTEVRGLRNALSWARARALARGEVS